MSITYTTPDAPPLNDRLEGNSEEPFIPVYARPRSARGAGRGHIRSWMILAPVGVLVLGGVAAVMLLNSDDTAVAPPLNEPAAAMPVLPAMAPVETAPLTTRSAPPPVEAVAPAPSPVREAAPVPARRAAVRAEAPVVTPPAPRVETLAEPTGVQPYTATLNTAPAAPETATETATPAPAQPPAPTIVVEPLG